MILGMLIVVLLVDIQVYNNNMSSQYKLALNPLGGNVGIGTNNQYIN